MSPQHRITSRSRISAGVASLIIATGIPLMGEHDLFQEPTPAPSQERAGIVTGHVYCGDTHEPARFASVIVQPLTLPGSTGKDHSTELEAPTLADTDFDGKFTVSDLPGSYLVLGWLPGYVSPFAQIKTDTDNPASVLQALETVLPRIEVKNHLVTTVDITLVRGAEVSFASLVSIWRRTAGAEDMAKYIRLMFAYQCRGCKCYLPHCRCMAEVKY